MDATSAFQHAWNNPHPHDGDCHYTPLGTYHACLAPNPILDAVRSRPNPRTPTTPPEIRRMVRVLALDGFTHTEAATLARWPKPVLAAARRCGRIRHLDGPSWAWARAMAHLFHSINQPALAGFYRRLSRIQFHRNRAFARVSAS